jgi:hypothetical protein
MHGDGGVEKLSLTKDVVVQAGETIRFQIQDDILQDNEGALLLKWNAATCADGPTR